MIPNRLFFIWAGKKNPQIADYIPRCIEAYKNMNPELEIIFYDIPNIDRSTNDDVVEFRRIIKEEADVNKRTVLTSYYYRDCGKCLHTPFFRPILRFCDAFRVYLINKYGGIYLDLDTMPLREFDEDFYNADVRTLDYNDNYFFAAEPGKLQEYYIRNNPKHLEMDVLYLSDPKNRISKNSYFKHFMWRSWQKQNIDDVKI